MNIYEKFKFDSVKHVQVKYHGNYHGIFTSPLDFSALLRITK